MSGQKSSRPGGGGTEPGGRFRLTRLRPGYVIADVDELIDRIEATLAGTAGPGRAITAKEVRAAQFGTTRLQRGYDEESVDNALDAYIERLSGR
jgi:DivIVA domain-containing protein